MATKEQFQCFWLIPLAVTEHSRSIFRAFGAFHWQLSNTFRATSSNFFIKSCPDVFQWQPRSTFRAFDTFHWHFRNTFRAVPFKACPTCSSDNPRAVSEQEARSNGSYPSLCQNQLSGHCSLRSRWEFGTMFNHSLWRLGGALSRLLTCPPLR